MIRSGSHYFEKEKLTSLALTLLLYYPLINAGITSLFSGLGLPGLSIVYPVLIGMEILVIYGSVFWNLKDCAYPLILSYGAVLFFYILTIVLYPENTKVLIGTARNMFLFCLPAFGLGFIVETVDSFWEYLCKLAPWMIAFGLLFVLFFEFDSDAGYSMWFGYQLAIPMLIIVWRLFNKGVKDLTFNIVLLIVGGLSIVVKGSRGPLLVIVLYVAVCIFKFLLRVNPDKKSLRLTIRMGRYRYSLIGMIVLILISGFAIYAIANIESIALELYNLFLGFGYDSRTLRVLSMQDALHYSAGRDKYWLLSLRLISASPIIGYGLSGDCVQIGKHFGVIEELYSGMHAHNIFLEVLLHWGIPIGAFLLLVSMIKAIKKLKNTREGTPERDLLVLLGVFVGVQCMVSINYLESIPLWLFLGLAMSSKDENYS